MISLFDFRDLWHDLKVMRLTHFAFALTFVLLCITGYLAWEGQQAKRGAMEEVEFLKKKQAAQNAAVGAVAPNQLSALIDGSQGVESGGEKAEEPGGEVDPELVERDGVAVAHPDDRDVFHGDERPADENEALGARVARLTVVDDHFLDEAGRARGVRVVAEELEEVGEHGGESRERRTLRMQAEKQSAGHARAPGAGVHRARS